MNRWNICLLLGSGGGGSGKADVAGAFSGARPGTSRPVSVQGRFVRLGTASMLRCDQMK